MESLLSYRVNSANVRRAVMPWSTFRSIPLIEADDGFARNQIAAAISSGVVVRLRRLLFWILRLLKASLKLGVSLVLTEEGLTVLKRILSRVVASLIDQKISNSLDSS